MKRITLFALLGAMPVAASAQLFSENFDVDNTSAWKFNSSITGDSATDNSGGEANFFFDYSTVGIPSAPKSAGGSTIGLKLEANVHTGAEGSTTGVFSGISVSPIGQSFVGDYVLRFDAWQNFTGLLPGGGSGTTQMLLAGLGSNENTAQFPGGTFNSVGFAGSADGGTGTDYRVYTASGAPLAASTGAYAAGNTAAAMNNSDPYYSSFTGSVPTAQTTYANSLGFANQTGSTNAGALGFAWRQWVIVKTGTTVTWNVDGKLIATASNVNPAGADIFLGQFDINGTASGQIISRQFNFGLVDNVEVVPEPASMLALGLGAAALLRRRKKA